MRATSKSSSISCPITVPTSIRGLLNRDRRATTPNATGISGATRAPAAGRRTTGYLLWRKCLGIRCAYGAILLPCLSARTARPQLAQSRSRRGDARRFALLVGARRRRFSGGCSLAFDRRTIIFATILPTRAGARARDPYQKLIPLYTTDRSEVHGVIARMRAPGRPSTKIGC